MVLAIALLGAAAYLLVSGSLLLRDRWNPQTGTLFSGVSLDLLAAALISLAAFAAAVARGWLRGDIAMPDRHRLRPHPDYKAQLIARYWYFLAVALTCLIGAFVLAARVTVP